jgi:hypothetical protein
MYPNGQGKVLLRRVQVAWGDLYRGRGETSVESGKSTPRSEERMGSSSDWAAKSDGPMSTAGKLLRKEA